MAAAKRTREIYEEETSMLVSVLLELKRPFKFSERKGSGTTEDPYYRTVEYMATNEDIKKISDYLKRLRKIQNEYLEDSM